MSRTLKIVGFAILLGGVALTLFLLLRPPSPPPPPPPPPPPTPRTPAETCQDLRGTFVSGDSYWSFWTEPAQSGDLACQVTATSILTSETKKGGVSQADGGTAFYMDERGVETKFQMNDANEFAQLDAEGRIVQRFVRKTDPSLDAKSICENLRGWWKDENGSFYLFETEQEIQEGYRKERYCNIRMTPWTTGQVALTGYVPPNSPGGFWMQMQAPGLAPLRGMMLSAGTIYVLGDASSIVAKLTKIQQLSRCLSLHGRWKVSQTADGPVTSEVTIATGPPSQPSRSCDVLVQNASGPADLGFVQPDGNLFVNYGGAVQLAHRFLSADQFVTLTSDGSILNYKTRMPKRTAAATCMDLGAATWTDSKGQTITIYTPAPADADSETQCGIVLGSGTNTIGKVRKVDGDYIYLDYDMGISKRPPVRVRLASSTRAVKLNPDGSAAEVYTRKS